MQKNISILIVDDEDDAATSMAALLELDGYDVQTANNGQAALEAARKYGFDCVLLDINMPGMDGAELAEKLRERFGGDITLVAMTGYGDDSARAQVAIQHTDHFFTKPVRAAQLKSVFHAMA